MIILSQNQLNQFGITVKELKEEENPNFLFLFHNQQQNKDYLIYLDCQNVSNRIDLFELELPVDLDLTTGNYIYKVFESTDLELSTEGKKLLELGKMKVKKEFDTNKHYTESNTNKVNYV